MLYKAYHILLLAQFTVINPALHKHESTLRFLILPWRIKRFHALLRAPRNHYFHTFAKLFLAKTL